MNDTNTPAHILIVEDESIVAADIESRLKELRYEVAGRTDYGEKAIELAGKLKPDLVLMDVMLKGQMRGDAAAKVIREQYRVPVVFLTGNSDLATFRSALGAEPYGYVIKPFEERELHIAIEIALDKHRQESEREALIRQLEGALNQVRVLQEMVPVCGWCKKIRDDDGYWKSLERYVSTHFQVGITHGMCPECYEKALAEVQEVKREKQRKASAAGESPQG